MKEYFGTTKDGKEVNKFTISNSNGITATILDYGATVTSLVVFDKDGKEVDIVLGYDTLAEYEENANYFGAIIGRNANRIKGGSFTIDNVTYALAQNDNDNNLHSGPKGFDRFIWTGEEKGSNAVTLKYSSPDMECGYPGNMEVSVTYELKDDNSFHMTYEATTDKATIANITSHTFYNLEGHAAGSIEGHTLQLFASHYNPTIDSKAIPTGENAPVEGTVFDFRAPKAIGQDIAADDIQLKYAGGYDHNFVVDGDPHTLRPFGIFSSDKSGIVMEVSSNQPGMQLYTGNFLKPHGAKGGKSYDFRYGFAVEPQYVPNAINDPNFESPILNPGENYKAETVLTFKTV